jgi:hypothetical protein
LGGVSLALTAGLTAIIKEALAATPNAMLIAVYSVGVGGGVLAGLLNVLKSHYKDAKDDRRDTPEDLRGCLHVILRVMCGRKGVADPPDGWMRLTVHRVAGDELEQVVDYVGSGDRGAGRRFRTNAGLIGAVLSEKRPLVFERPAALSWERWVEYLVQKMNIPREQALRTRKDRFAFMAVGMRDLRGSIAAVVYADAAEPGFFDGFAQGIIVHGCIGLANWVNERYA